MKNPLECLEKQESSVQEKTGDTEDRNLEMTQERKKELRFLKNSRSPTRANRYDKKKGYRNNLSTRRREKGGELNLAK